MQWRVLMVAAVSVVAACQAPAIPAAAKFAAGFGGPAADAAVAPDSLSEDAAPSQDGAPDAASSDASQPLDDSAGADDATAANDATDAGSDEKVAEEVAADASDAEPADGSNQPPTAPTVTIEPAKPTTQAVLAANLTALSSDPDGDSAKITYQFQWMKNAAPTDQKSSKVQAGVAKKGEKWQVQVIAVDEGGAQSPPATADTVIADAAPTPPSVQLQPADATMASELVCALVAESSDPDGDNLTYTWQWLVNGYANSLQAPKILATALVSDASQTPAKPGDKVQCVATAVETGIGLTSPAANSNVVELKTFDACAAKPGPCGSNATCQNGKSSEAVCTCNAGYAGDGKTCFDIDECATGAAACDKNADCKNTTGSFVCACKTGFQGDGKTCVDIDECAAKTACGPNAVCKNTAGSYTCTCGSGFAGDGKTCTDINECAQTPGPCDVHAMCTNVIGNYQCECLPGWQGDGKLCSSSDPCALNPLACDPNATCKTPDGPGAPVCLCNSGYLLKSGKCTDIDECAQKFCSPNSTCVNSPGSYACTCNNGYQGDGLTCTDIDECPPQSFGWSWAKSGPASWMATSAISYLKWQVVSGQVVYGDVTSTYSAKDGVINATLTSPQFTLSAHPQHKLKFAYLDSWPVESQGTHTLQVRLVTAAGEIGLGTFTTSLTWTAPQNIALDLKGFGGQTLQLRFVFDANCKSGCGLPRALTIGDIDITAAGSPCDVHATCKNLPGAYTCTCDAAYKGNGAACKALGSSDAPAKACADILSAYGQEMPQGVYSLDYTGQLGQYVCTADGWTQILNENYATTAGTLFAPAAKSLCNPGGQVLGGFNVAGAGYVSKAKLTLPAHTQLRYSLGAVCIDGWNGEKLQLLADGVEAYGAACTASSIFASQCGSQLGGETELASGIKAISHGGASAELTWTSTLKPSAGVLPAYWGARFLTVWVK